MTLVLKLGGSVITDKAEEGRLDEAVLATIAADVAAGDPRPLVIVHGGGSFGHPAAARHGLSAEAATTDPAAIAEVHEAMLELNGHVVDGLVAAGLGAIGVHPLSIARRASGELHLETAAVEAMLAEGFVPVLHGDGVITDGAGVTVLSGDDLVASLAPSLGADRVGLVSDVQGVIGRDGEVIDRIRSLEEVDTSLGGSTDTDVTGGMAHKVGVLLALDVPASIFDPAGLAAFLDGDEVGTMVGG